jgi:hypothetical protein
MEIDELHYAATYKTKADHLEISQFIREKGEENDVLA